ncbi:DUF2256 domain-containing protein [Roseovarius mucosus]|uniref:DUF2256 domain-containing protein n=1 Tax=Roseovarius mucosus TaxID=215743 RepID=A0A1V0RLV6_9RHOB|nr:DUF2256 domain-containing protein [Roseovarius mucosus]ARE82676.1 hypothetical protein ROSMUCSMR3_01182 [Roseovarius mucosus]MBW4973611.1 DUF2256 domain-containing protein [Roseovarius mucosus]
MPRAPRKSDLPVKTCATCGRPMEWRRKWARVWDEVRHCSERCRRSRKRAGVDEKDPTGRDAFDQ